MARTRHHLQEKRVNLGLPSLCLTLILVMSVVSSFNNKTTTHATPAFSRALQATSKTAGWMSTPLRPITESVISGTPRQPSLQNQPSQRSPKSFSATKPPESSTVPDVNASFASHSNSARNALLSGEDETSTSTNAAETVSNANPLDLSGSSVPDLAQSSHASSQPQMQEKGIETSTYGEGKKNNGKNKTNCEPVYHVSGMKGRVLWTRAKNDCASHVTWNINVPQGYGIVLDLHEWEMHDYCFAYINNLTNSVETLSVSDRNLSSIMANRNIDSPILTRLNELVIRIITPVTDRYKGVTRLNLSFYALPLDSFPTEVINEYYYDDDYYYDYDNDYDYDYEYDYDNDYDYDYDYNYDNESTSRENDYDYDNVSGPRESATMYDCAGEGVQVPEAFLCDGLRQCVRGEDEANCSYQNKGCGDWVPYKDKCLKFVFDFDDELLIGHIHTTMPYKAEENCRSEYIAELAILPDDEGLQIVRNIVRRSGFPTVAVGLTKFRPATVGLQHLYRYTWQWGGMRGPIAHDQPQIQRDATLLGCAALTGLSCAYFEPLPCVYSTEPPAGYVCMKQNILISASKPNVSPVIFSGAMNSALESIRTKTCPDGYVVQQFHACTWGNQHLTATLSLNNLPLFQCRFGPAVHYTQVCDGLEDCADGSDETSCTKPRFPSLKNSSFLCQTFQLVMSSSRCDGAPDCFDGSDEDYCSSCNEGALCPGIGCIPQGFEQFFDNCPVTADVQHLPLHTQMPAEVYLDGWGWSLLKPATENCSDTTFRCQSGLCIPSYMINNGEKDCPYGEDEDIPWENVTCPGYYRCHEYGLCLHPDLVCNGVYECPNKDDERYCHLPCPDNCTCEGFAYSCNATFDPFVHLDLRYLDLSGAQTLEGFLEDLYVMEFLRFLNLSSCQLRNLTLRDTTQLMILDLSHNLLKGVSSLNLTDLSRLIWLDLSYNPLVSHLDLTFAAFLKKAGLVNLETLILTSTEVTSISDRALSPLSKLTSLDMRSNRLTTYGSDAFWGVSSLKVLYSDDGKMCCQYFHLNPLNECHAPVDELSSCSDLLRSDFFRVFLWTLSVLSIAGNAGVLVYRTIADERSTSLPFRLLVKNLCASDLLMGVYLMMIGVADELFRGQYVEKEREWRHSAWCTAAGFLAFVSSEVSALVICCITLDRLLVLCYPLKASLHLKAKSVIALCCCVWCTCLVLAAVPLMAGLEFYGQNGICLPLPITRQQFSGQFYAFAVFIVFNFVLFVLIGVGQLVIYTAVRRTGAATGSKRRQQDTTIARRLFLVVFTDFCCWFPVGLIGLLAFSGVPIPGVVNVWIAIFVLPLNSALNPFLYTLNTLLEKVEKRRLEARTKRLMAKVQSEVPKWQPNAVEEMMRVCVRSKLVEREKVLRIAGLSDGQLNLLARPVDKDNAGCPSKK